ncbi:MAG: hypothetical protein AABZ12_03470 [Planctomycetota bacterium]
MSLDNRQSPITDRQSTTVPPSLNVKPGSSTAKQHSSLVCAALRHGVDVHELRRMVGGSIRQLSARQCSDWIKRFSGRDLPHPPGKKPSLYAGRRATPGVSRMITDDQCAQISRLALDYFHNHGAAAREWLRKNFGVLDPRDLLTAKRGGEVIVVLKGMIQRREPRALDRD